MLSKEYECIKKKGVVNFVDVNSLSSNCISFILTVCTLDPLLDPHHGGPSWQLRRNRNFEWLLETRFLSCLQVAGNRPMVLSSLCQTPILDMFWLWW